MISRGEQNERGGKSKAGVRSQADTSQTQRSSESKIFRKKKAKHPKATADEQKQAKLKELASKELRSSIQNE